MSKKKIIIISIILAVIVIGGVIGVLFLNHNNKLERNNSISVADNSDINDTDKKVTEDNKTNEATTNNKTTDSEETTTDTEDNKKTDNSDNKKDKKDNKDDNSEKTSTSDDIRNGDVTVTDERRSTTQTTTESTTVAPEPTHNHNYSPTYGTTNVQQYASDGTTNDYNKPIYGTQQVEKTREVPVYETHMIDINGNDATANWNNYGRAEWQSSGNWNDYASDYQNMKTWLLATIGSSAMSKQDVQVGTTTETYYETEEVVTGYEQLGTISKKTITGYTCSCGKSISAATYVSQYGTPSGYYLDGEILVKK